MTLSRRSCPAAVALLLAACGGSSPTRPGPMESPRPLPRKVVIAAAGDIACGPSTRGSCRQMDTATAVEFIHPDAVLALGDNQYEQGELANYLRMYAPAWGRFKAITYPAPGNHEYETPRAAGYFDYFNGVGQQTGPAGDRARGYYSFDLGAWHIVSLNSNCADIGGCQAGSPQELWLRLDLALNADTECTLAYFHHPLFASGRNGNQPQVRPLWQALYDFDADVVLNGHEHIYERYAPQTPQQVADPRRGIRQIIVGTGGHSLTPFVGAQRNSEVAHNQTFGVLRMELRPNSYDWEFMAAPGAESVFSDSGSQSCH